MNFNFLNSSSILKKFLIFNFIVFLVLAIFTYLYLKAIKPDLIKNRSQEHVKIIENTSDHLKRLNINFTKDDATKFFLSSRFLFQNLDRVQLYDKNIKLIADTDILDLDPRAFSSGFEIFEIPIDNTEINQDEFVKKSYEKSLTVKNEISEIIKTLLKKRDLNDPFTTSVTSNNNFVVTTIKKISSQEELKGYIAISEVANDILIAENERKNFIIRTVIIFTIVVLIFSIFLNTFILKPIGKLVKYTREIKSKNEKKSALVDFFDRSDEVGLLARSLKEMTENLQQRINIAETFSSDLAHEIRNPLASLKGASEILNNTEDQNKRLKLLNIITEDVERIERLITDYSQMLKDEASLSRSKMEKINLMDVVQNVCDDFNNNVSNSEKNINIKIFQKPSKNTFKVFGVESRLEQILANLLDNAISFSPENGNINVSCIQKEKTIHLIVEDEGPGFNEKNINQVFKRFYSNRPQKFGKHSGLGLNIVKNITELHGGQIQVSNGSNKGARIEIQFPSSTL